MFYYLGKKRRCFDLSHSCLFNSRHPSWLVCCMMEILVLFVQLASARYKIQGPYFIWQISFVIYRVNSTGCVRPAWRATTTGPTGRGNLLFRHNAGSVIMDGVLKVAMRLQVGGKDWMWSAEWQIKLLLITWYAGRYDLKTLRKTRRNSFSIEIQRGQASSIKSVE
jgi:hypothetical protein